MKHGGLEVDKRSTKNNARPFLALIKRVPKAPKWTRGGLAVDKTRKTTHRPRNATYGGGLATPIIYRIMHGPFRRGHAQSLFGSPL